MKFPVEHGIWFEFTSRTDPRYSEIRKEHYVEPRGEIGRQIQFLVWRRGNDSPIGIITAGSATYAIRSRDEFFGITKENRNRLIQRIVNNTVCRMVIRERGLMQRVLSIWRRLVPYVWFDLYGDDVIGYETLVEPKKDVNPDNPGEDRDGHNYKGDNWTERPETQGSAKRHSGIRGKHTREATTKKLVFVKKSEDYAWMHAFRNAFPRSQGMRSLSLYSFSRHGSRPLAGNKNYDRVLKSSWRGGSAEEKQRATWLARRRKHLVGACYFLSRPPRKPQVLKVFIAERKNLAV